jgi:hypothetical protein
VAGQETRERSNRPNTTGSPENNIKKVTLMTKTTIASRSEGHRNSIPGLAVPKTILVVDGAASVLAGLRNSGFTVLSVSTPEAAIQISLDFPGKIDLLLTEYDPGNVWTRSRKTTGEAADQAEDHNNGSILNAASSHQTVRSGLA